MNQEKPDQEIKIINKGLIFLKSSVLMLFIVLVVLVIAFIMSRNKKQHVSQEMANICRDNQAILIDSEIEKVEVQGGVLNVLTKFDKDKNGQELIRINAACGNEINRITFTVIGK
jgi:cbb3-type cytochrome oxidase subunit 3